MRFFSAVRPCRRARLSLVVAAALGAVHGVVPPARAIEMFTYFGDGSRIGLPSLEVPIEAYPGIPLRSDRIRARNRALAARRGMPAPPAGALRPARGITIRTMPAPEAIPVAPEPR
ncbi:MAG: hypothetical protein EBZ74_07390 [Planctomycetia bacterium]|nr:hypothetical protein [Planctomycetia bacterium]